jgi:hypothetical protein
MFKKKYYNFLFVFLFILLIFSYFSKIHYKLDDVDELNYLSDSLLLLEGELPSSKHAPSGLTTWVGTVLVFFDFLINIIVNQKFKSISDIMQSFDQIIFKHYENLLFIKFSLFLLNTILLISLFKLDKKKIFLLIFLFFLTSPIYIGVTFSGKPFFTAALFAAISLLLRDQNKKIALIFLGFAMAEKIEYILLINLICSEKNNKFNLYNYLFVVLIFLATAPWFSISILQNIKIQSNFAIWNAAQYIDIKQKFLIYFLLISYISIFFSINYLKSILNKFLAYIFLFSCVFYLVYLGGYYIRWFIPLFIIFAYDLSKLKFFNKKIFLIYFIIFGNLIYFNSKNLISDLEILEMEKTINSSNIINEGLLIERAGFKNYFYIKNNQISKINIKNINFFKDKNAPISFSNSGNIEKLYLRRYEFLAKYGDNKSINKYVISFTGLASNDNYWCIFLSNNAYIYSRSHGLSKCK